MVIICGLLLHLEVAMRMLTVINKCGHFMTRVQTQTSVTSALSLQ